MAVLLRVAGVVVSGHQDAGANAVGLDVVEGAVDVGERTAAFILIGGSLPGRTPSWRPVRARARGR
jgi:hypothetical protein